MMNGSIRCYIVGVNLAFFPHFLGLAAIPRSYSDYPDAYITRNIISSVWSTVSFISVIISLFIIRENVTSNRLTLFPTHTSNSVEWLQNCPPAEHKILSTVNYFID